MLRARASTARCHGHVVEDATNFFTNASTFDDVKRSAPFLMFLIKKKWVSELTCRIHHRLLQQKHLDPDRPVCCRPASSRQTAPERTPLCSCQHRRQLLLLLLLLLLRRKSTRLDKATRQAAGRSRRLRLA